MTFTEKKFPTNIPLLFKQITEQNINSNLQGYKDQNKEFQYKTYGEVYEQVITFAVGLKSIGIKKFDHVGLIADNRHEWLITDLSILSLGACDVPRGCDTMGQEISFILSFAECRACCFETEKQFQKIVELKDKATECLNILETIIFFESISDETRKVAKESNISIYLYEDIMEIGEKERKDNPDRKSVV